MSGPESVEQALDRISAELNQSPTEMIGYDRLWMEQIGLGADEVARHTERAWRFGFHYHNVPDRNMTLRTALVIFEPKEKK